MNLAVGLLLITALDLPDSFIAKTGFRDMRYQHLKLKKPHSTKAERRFAELLKQLHLPFKTKVKIAGHEVDFLIGRLALEINGHKQNVKKNIDIMNAGYTPFHLQNNQVTPALREWLRKI